ncbi:MAG TPA: NIPSNAP family protein [Acidimicrobiia bacterium]|nr:NIPSNAP family protein [Acidimicrobiia bacterium]
MIHQLRIYEIFDHNKQAFHDRFRDHALRIMQSYGFEFVSIWESSVDGRTECAYLLEWADAEAMSSAWAAFREDQEWKDIKRVTSADQGDLVGEIEDKVLRLTSYSPER